MKLVLDAMGGDRAPQEMVKGAAAAAREYGLEVLLVGQRPLVEPELEKHYSGRLTLVEAAEVVEMADSPTLALRQKRDSSISVGIELVRQGQASAFVSAGNSGAIMATALLALGRQEGVERPALGTVFNSSRSPVLLLDVGANPDCKPSFLAQFARLGSEYMERSFALPHPRVGLLNIGEEEGKGNQLAREAYDLLKKSGLNFVGNVEGKDIPKGVAEVVVTDGFTGNVILKLSEGLGEELFGWLGKAFMKKLRFRLAALILGDALREVARRLDYAEYGGAPLLGVKGTVIICHGRSNAKAIKNALLLAHRAVQGGHPLPGQPETV